MEGSQGLFPQPHCGIVLCWFFCRLINVAALDRAFLGLIGTFNPLAWLENSRTSLLPTSWPLWELGDGRGGAGGKFLLSFCPFPPLDSRPRWEGSEESPWMGTSRLGTQVPSEVALQLPGVCTLRPHWDSLLVGEHHFQGPQALDLDLNLF